MKDRAYVVLSIDQLREIVRGATKKAKQHHSSRLTARMAGDAFAFYHP